MSSSVATFMQLSDRDRVAHLLRRFGLGASEAEIEYYGRGGWLNAVDRLLDYGSAPDTTPLTPEELVETATGKPNKNGMKARFDQLQLWWITRMVRTQRPLEEKMTLFWHDHFATSGEKVTAAEYMAAQNQILREGATGKFPALLSRVSKDPAMVFWLDNELNVKEHPNENFAREVMELFTLGIGNYTEKDVQEAARAFTGWTLVSKNQKNRKNLKAPKNGKLAGNQVFDEGDSLHDPGLKTVLGNKGPFNGDDILAILCARPRTAWYITWKLWRFFAYDDPEPAVIDRVSQRFYDSGLDIKVGLREIMTSPEFFSAKSMRRLYKNPVDFTVATLRQSGFAQAEYAQVYKAARAVRTASKSMGMDLLFPPDVSGWGGGEKWVTTATILERIKWAGTLFGGTTVAAGKNPNRGFQLGIRAVDLFPNGAGPDVAAKTIASIFDAQVSDEKMRLLMDAIRREAPSGITGRNANAASSAATRLLFGSPEFQFS